MTRTVSTALVILGALGVHVAPVHSQFAPQAGQPGSTAMGADSAVFRDWAISCNVYRGHKNIAQPDSGRASAGTSIYATGKSDGPLTVSLGDSGIAILQFSAPFHDGPGYDFAVFENGFLQGEHAFLELAFVEVSSDGINYFRFPSVSLTDTSSQVESFGTLDATRIHNLAGKYIAGYGVPFDLADLPDTAALDKSAVSHIRVVDVVGSIDPQIGSRDSQGNLINDPWPTPFESSGFDLEAIGIIHSNIPVGISLPKSRNQWMNEGCFDLTGRPVSCDTKGKIIIRNGEKVYQY
ncbi:MAG: hypothetical protein Kow0075_00570 [Salibacteraceae bacterium]